MDAKVLVGGIVAGAIAGLTVGLLIAPATGKETRAELANSCKKIMDNIASAVNDSIKTVRENITGSEGPLPTSKPEGTSGGNTGA
jgi:gas vesicle protein